MPSAELVPQPAPVSNRSREKGDRVSLYLIGLTVAYVLLWLLAARIIVPHLITSGYQGHPAFLAHLMPGRGTHPLSSYLQTWHHFSSLLLVGGIGLFAFLLITTRPELERVCSALPAGIIVLALVIPLSTVLDLKHIRVRCLDIDEITSVVIARATPAVFWNTALTKESNGWPYLGFLRIWLRPWEDELGVRLLSVLFAVGAVPLVYAIGKHLVGKSTGVLASALLAVNSFEVKYSREARTYSLLLFAAVLSTYFFVRTARRPSLANWLGYVLASAFAIHCHVFFVLVLGAHSLSLLVFRWKQTDWRSWILANCSIGILASPVPISMMKHNVGQIDWIEPFHARVLYDFFMTLTGGGGLILLLAYAAAVAVAFGLALRAWSRDHASDESWRWGLLLLWLLLPVAVVAAASLRRPLFVNRYLIFCLPPLTLLAAFVIDRVRSIPLRAGIAIFLLAFSARGVAWSYHWHGSEDWRGASRYLLSTAHGGDAVLFYHPYMRLPIEFYGGNLDQGPGQPTVVFPASWDRSHYISQPEIQQEPDTGLLAGIPAHYHRVWLVLGHDQFASRWAASRRMQDYLAAHYRFSEEKDFAQVRVILYQTCPISRHETTSDANHL
jgi:mannosyltransferase